MKNKLLASVVTLLLLISVFGTAFNVRFTAKADTLYHLNVYTDPDWLMSYAQINGTDDYPDGTIVDLEAPQIVYVTDDIRYIFDYWDVDGVRWTGDGTPWKIQVTMDSDHNATAHYKVEYKVTVTVPSSPDWIANFTAYIMEYPPGGGAVSHTNNNASVSIWVANGTKVRAGVKGQGVWWGVPCVYAAHNNEIAKFLNWSDVGLSHVDGSGIAWSNEINVTGPTYPVMEWDYVYMIYVKDEPDVWSGVESYENWYDRCTEVSITADSPLYFDWDSTYKCYKRRWILDYWTVDGVKAENGTPSCVKYVFMGNNTIVIHVDGNHTVVAHFKLQWRLEFSDNINGWSGVSAHTGYYDENKVYTFTAPQVTNETACKRYRFNRWYGYEWPPGWFGNFSNIEFTVNVTKFMRFYADYKLQWHVNVLTDPLGLVDEGIYLTLTGDFPEGSAWFDHGTYAYVGAPWYFGEEEWKNGTRYHFYMWKYDNIPKSSNNETRMQITTCINFTAVYKREYAVVVSAEPADFAWEKTYWFEEGKDVTVYVADATWTDPKGWTYYFDYWETSPYDPIHPVTWRNLYLHINTTYTAVAHYRLGTTLVVNQGEFEFWAAGNAYGREFKVEIVVTNVKELYAAQFKLVFNDPHTFLELVDVDTSPLDEVWPDGWFVVEDTDYSDGYDFVGTALGNETDGFTGTHTLVILTFRINYEPCVDDIYSLLDIRRAYLKLYHKNGTEIPWDPELDGQVFVYAVKPTLKMIPTICDGGKTVVVDILAVNVTKLHDYYFKIYFEPTQLQVRDITLDKSFLQAPYTTESIQFSNTGGWITIRVVSAGPLANGTGPLAQIIFDVIVEGTCLDAVTWDTDETYISEKCPDTVYLYKDYPSPSPPKYNFLELYDAFMPDPLPGDANLDGVVDVYDLRLVAAFFGTNYAPCDFNNDHKVDILDLITVAVNFGKTWY